MAVSVIGVRYGPARRVEKQALLGCITGAAAGDLGAVAVNASTVWRREAADIRT